MRVALAMGGVLLSVACGSSGSSGGAGGASSGGTSGTAGTAGSGGAGGTGAESGTGGIAAGGAGGVSAVSCVVDAGATVSPNPSVQNTVSGTDGTFTDTCDSQGNLLEYGCETKQICSEPPNPDCTSYQTGKTASQGFDCDGKCKAGRCDARCPAHGDQVVAKGTDTSGKYLFENATDQRRYACTLAFSGSGCSPGAGGTIAGLGLKSNFCTGGEFGNIQVAGCSYTCTFAY